MLHCLQQQSNLFFQTYKGNITDHARDNIYSPYSGSKCGVRLEVGRY